MNVLSPEYDWKVGIYWRQQPLCTMLVDDRPCNRPANHRRTNWGHWSTLWCDEHARVFDPGFSSFWRWLLGPHLLSKTAAKAKADAELHDLIQEGHGLLAELVSLREHDNALRNAETRLGPDW